MKKVLLTLVIIGFTNVFSQTKKDYSFTYSTDSIIQTGFQHYEKGNYSDAVAEFQKIAKTDPKYLLAQHEIALSLFADDKKEQLLKHFETLYNEGKMKEQPTLYTLYGTYYSDEKEYDKAEKIFNEGAQYMSNSSNFLYNQAILYLRKEDRQKSVDLLKKAVTINPNLASGHYFLGAIALENGNIVEGSLALLSYLAIAPAGKFSEEAILKLNNKFGENYLTKGKLVFSTSGDNFEELETILRNQLPLKKAYKLKTDIDDVIMRQIQAIMEYSLEHKMGDGFFETTYMPWIKDVVAKKQFEGFSYYILLGLEEKLGKEITKHKKVITTFYEKYYLVDFWNQFAKRNMEHFGQKQEVVIYLNDGNPFIIGPIVNNKKEGKFKLLGENGNLTGELNLKNDELEGLQKYYDDKGNLEMEKNFTAGKLNGETKEYYSNGNLSTIDHYKDDVLHGVSSTYHINGGKNCELNFTNGERDGALTCYYPNGTKSSTVTYTNGKLNGPYTIYNELGDITVSTTYKNDEINGKYLEYFDGKTIKAEADYTDGKCNSSYKKYYSNNKLEYESFYANGKITKTINYFYTGEKSSELIFNDKEELESYIYYNSKGEKYFEEKYKGGELKSGLQYSLNNPKPTEVNLTKKAFSIFSLKNNKQVSGFFEKGKKSGEWNYYYTNGNLKIKENYTAGNQTGLSHIYNYNGLLQAIKHYANDELNGLYEVYDNGILNEYSYYTNGTQNGPFSTYYADGTIQTEGFLQDGEMVNFKNTYRQSGKLSQVSKFVEDEIIFTESYDVNGKKEFEFDYKNKSGKINISLNSGASTQEFEMVNGNYNGKFTSKDKLGNKISDFQYVNGKMNNNYKYYSPNGTLMFERNYYCGLINGTDAQYDLAGNLRITSEYSFGDDNGKTIRYYHNKSKMFEYNEFDGLTEGDYIYYNQKGEPILKLEYDGNALVSYSTLSKTGGFNEKVATPNESAEITSYYPNGKVAMKVNFTKGSINGKLEINNAEGKPEYEANYKNGLFEGERTEYYTNGKVYKKENLKNGDFEGVHTYFKEDGKPWLTANYKNDELHGDFLIYTNGVLTLTKKYDSDELVEIIK
jgi:antitoxin component YwqK of YwqJK toxin-antitoxin module/Tfp pilus assembly protein PilF